MTRKKLTLAAVAATALCLLAGCSEDEPVPGGGRAARVMVIDEESRTPVAGVKIVVMDGDTNTPATAPAVTDANGMVAFSDLPVGRYPVLAFGGFRHLFFGFHPPTLQVVNPPRSAGGILIPAGPAAKTPPAPEIPPLVFLAYPAVRDSLPRFRGRVVDAGTGDPLEGAFLGVSPYLDGYEGRTEPSDDVTLADGWFSVTGIPIAADPVTGNLTQILPLKVVRHGYRPVLWTYDFPNGSEETDVAGVTIALEPVGPGDTASVAGQVVRGGAPLAGAAVGLGLVGDGTKTGPGLTGWGTVTDEQGMYRIEGLPAGRYLLHVGYPVGDGVVGPAAPWQVEVGGGQAVTIPPLEGRVEIEAIQPYQGDVTPGQPDRLIWTAVPGAVEYEVWLDRGLLGRFDDFQAAIPEDLVLGPGLHVWEVGAFAEGDTLLGFSQVRFWFRIDQPSVR